MKFRRFGPVPNETDFYLRFKIIESDRERKASYPQQEATPRNQSLKLRSCNFRSTSMRHPF